ncbi:MAG: hypothetical protein MUE70_09855 [Desulfobacterales bacterium]|jgi:hypothetical protein|nr:hypothetical protein [Desulfobacterales bacterium]
MNPLKVKIFTYFSMNINPPNEIQINRWLAENPDIEVVDIVQSESMAVKTGEMERNLSITLVYRDKEGKKSKRT